MRNLSGAEASFPSCETIMLRSTLEVERKEHGKESPVTVALDLGEGL